MTATAKTNVTEPPIPEATTLELRPERDLQGHIGDTGPQGDPGPDGAPAPDDPRRMVRIKLHRDRRNGKGLYVNVNNHSYFIPRGEVVEVPAYIAEVIENSAVQDENTARLIETLTENTDF